jgi:hypothetical protein
MTKAQFGLNILLSLIGVGLFSVAILLWLQTPQLFEYFNQAFCAH